MLNKYNNPFNTKNTNKLKKYLGNFFMVVGFLVIIFSSLIFLVKINDGFSGLKNYVYYTKKIESLNKFFFGNSFFSAKNFKEYSEILKNVNFNIDDVPKLDLEIDYKNLSILEKDRKLFDLNKKTNWANGKITFSYIDKSQIKINHSGKIKLKAKGDRYLHRLNINEMSFKIDLKDKYRIKGVEEFSIYKPIARNYAWELLVNDVFKNENFITNDLDYMFVEINGKDNGVYFFEEGFGKGFLERKKLKDGLVLGLLQNDNDGSFDIKNYNSEFLSSFPEKSLLTFQILREFLNNDQFNTFEYFDLEEWARFFALIDVFGAHHAAVSSQLKLYFSHTDGKFHPIFNDAHIGSVRPDQVFYPDFISGIPQCGFVCDDYVFIKKFFNEKNYLFVQNYYKFLDEFVLKYNPSTKNDIYDSNKIKILNNILYSEFSRSDAIWSKGIGFYYFKFDYLYERFNFIKEKLSISIAKNDGAVVGQNYFISGFMNDFDLSPKISNKIISNSHSITNNVTYKDVYFKNCQLSMAESTILVLLGNTKIDNCTFSGSGMITQLGGKIAIENTNFSNLKEIPTARYNWSGGINIVNSSEVLIDNVALSNIDAEDAINFIDSKVDIKSIKIFNSKSDAIDSDFSEINIQDLYCENITNDCLDISQTFVSANVIKAINVKDKVISVGEMSTINIDELISENSEIIIAAKDGSVIDLNILNETNSKLIAALYKKKSIFDNDNYTKIRNYNDNKLINHILNDENFLVSENSHLSVNQQDIQPNFQSDKIEEMLYGNLYGRKTIRIQ